MRYLLFLSFTLFLAPAFSHADRGQRIDPQLEEAQQFFRDHAEHQRQQGIQIERNNRRAEEWDFREKVLDNQRKQNELLEQANYNDQMRESQKGSDEDHNNLIGYLALLKAKQSDSRATNYLQIIKYLYEQNNQYREQEKKYIQAIDSLTAQRKTCWTNLATAKVNEKKK